MALVLVAPSHGTASEPGDPNGPAEVIHIYGRRWAAGSEQVPEESLKSPRFLNAGEAIEELPGVSAVRRGASATEPVIRGMGWERVSTQIGHLQTYGACPSRMDPPITYVKPTQVQEVLVIRSLPSVTLGPGGTGGRIVVNSDYERPADGRTEVKGEFRSGYDGTRDGWSTGASLSGGNRWLDALGSFEALQYNDYESGDGTEVPANQNEYGGALSFGLRPTPGQRWFNTLNYVREEDVDYPSLPMDTVDSDYWAYTTGYRVESVSPFLDRFEVGGGYLNIDHLMNNAQKPDREVLATEAPSDTVSYAAHAALVQRWTPTLDLNVGLDFHLVERDALRTRRFLTGATAGKTFQDRIWPDAEQHDLGGFAELAIEPRPAWLLRLGARVDRVDSSAGAADAPSLGGMTVVENWVAFYGPDAANFDRAETLGLGNAILEWAFSPSGTTHLGTGVSTRAAGVTERYFAFAPAPGGFQVGNPTLDAEKKIEAEWGLDWGLRWAELSVSAYHAWVKDYILQTEIDRRDVNGDGTLDLVRGFENIEARLYGFESAVTVNPSRHWSIPLALSYTRGRNASDDLDLPEIPPLEGRAALVGRWDGTWPGSVEIGGRFAADQNDVDEEFPEDDTPGFAVLHLRGTVRLFDHLQLDAGVENLFNKNYNEHLTREAMFAAEDLRAGDEVPAPGRGFYVAMRAAL